MATLFWLMLMTLQVRAEEFRLDGWVAVVEPETLAIRMRIGGDELVVAGGGIRLGERGLKARVTPAGRRLRVRIESDREQVLEWPRTGFDTRMKALILPEGEGLYVAMENAAWRKRVAGCYTAHGNLSLPLWAFQTGARTITYHTPTDIRTELCVEEKGNRLEAVARHRFLQRDGLLAYEVEIWPGGASPIDPAREYRAGLTVPGLAAKMKANADVGKLMGAIHMYVWGDGRQVAFLDDLKKAGVKRAWIGYDQNPGRHKDVVGRAFIEAAKAAGYLVGPYDTYNNAQDRRTAEDAVSRWPGNLYPAGCVVNAGGERRTGFAGRGCELSSEALARSAEKPLAARLREQLRDGPNSYFLDVDAFGELHDDYSPEHPMTQHRDRLNRLARMTAARDRGVVFGSEHGAAWAVPVLDFGHGSLSVQNRVLWPRKKEWGGWWPPERPGIFFKPVEPGADFAAAKFDPAVRIPLYQAAFHDAVVSTDRWDVPLAKFPALLGRRLLLELLYGSPSMWALDRRQLREHAPLVTRLAAFFEPFHREVGPLPLTGFEWLTPDGLVQRTRFGADVAVTANFGSPGYGALRPGCVSYESPRGASVFCP